MQKFTDFFQKMDKTKWLILGLSGILLLVVALPADRLAENKEDAALQQSLDAVQAQEDMVQAYGKQTARELEQILGYMDGVGEVRVMVTFQDNGENIVEKDISRSDSAQDSTQYQESTIYGGPAGEAPYVSQQKLPAVEGVLVIAQGGEDPRVKQEILDAVTALFAIETHKVKVVKMQNE